MRIEKDSATPRRTPIQRRARDRVNRILTAAEALLVERGVGDLKMNEVAERAEVPIGSVYQYFASREDLLGQLVTRYHQAIEDYNRSLFKETDSISGFLTALRSILDFAWTYLHENTGYREIWFGAQTFEPLRQLDWEDTFCNASILSDTLKALLPSIPPAELEAFCIIVCDSSGSTARMAVQFPERAAQLQEQSWRMITSRLMEFVSRDTMSGAG